MMRKVSLYSLNVKYIPLICLEETWHVKRTNCLYLWFEETELFWWLSWNPTAFTSDFVSGWTERLLHEVTWRFIQTQTTDECNRVACLKVASVSGCLRTQLLVKVYCLGNWYSSSTSCESEVWAAPRWSRSTLTWINECPPPFLPCRFSLITGFLQLSGRVSQADVHRKWEGSSEGDPGVVLLSKQKHESAETFQWWRKRGQFVKASMDLKLISLAGKQPCKPLKSNMKKGKIAIICFFPATVASGEKSPQDVSYCWSTTYWRSLAVLWWTLSAGSWDCAPGKQWECVYVCVCVCAHWDFSIFKRHWSFKTNCFFSLLFHISTTAEE